MDHSSIFRVKNGDLRVLKIKIKYFKLIKFLNYILLPIVFNHKKIN